MTESTVQKEMSEQEQEQRNELFRYTDLSHPLMQVLFNLKMNPPSEAE